MKKSKLFSAVLAATVTASALCCSASAALTVPSAPTIAIDESAGGMFKCMIYASGKEIAPDYALSDIASFTFTITPEEPEWFTGDTGGALVTSCGPVTATPEDHNWISKEYWGILDEELGIASQNPDSAIQAVKVGDYTYTLTCPVDETNCPYDIVTSTEGGWFAICLSEWGTDMSAITVVSLELNDASGNTLVKYDGNGNVISSTAAPVEEEIAPADTAEAVVTEAPAAVVADSDKSSNEKTNSDTGIEGVGGIIALAILASGILIAAKKR